MRSSSFSWPSPLVTVFATLALAGCGGPLVEPATIPPPATVPGPADASAALGRAEPRADLTLLPRQTFSGNPDRAGVKLSPDGKRLSFLAAEDGVLNVWVAPVDAPENAKAMTHSKERPIRNYQWAFDNAHFVYEQDAKGDENFHIYAVDAKTGETRDLTPFEKTQAHIENVNAKHPGEIAVGLNDRDPHVHDIYRLDLKTGKRTLVFQNNEGYAGFTVDDDFAVRLAEKQLPDGSKVISKRGAGKDAPFTPFVTAPLEDELTTVPLSFEATGKTFYMSDARGRNTSAAFAVDYASGKATLLAEDPRADMGEVLTHPVTGKLQAVSFTYDRATWKALDKAIEPDLAYLKTVAKGEMHITSRTLDDTRWIVTYDFDDGPARTYRYDRATKKATFLFVNRKSLEGVPLQPMQSRVIPSRDGLSLVSYLTLPKAADPVVDGKPAKPLPLVLFVHGGPWARDTWGFNAGHQWLASRGYAVLGVNFRGSTGFGKSFINAGNGEWGGKMHQDLLDAVAWAVKEGIADKDKVAILGGSYGGYSALVGATMTPDTFACAVDVVGPSNLQTLLETIPPYWQTELEAFVKRIGGDHRTPEGRKFLSERSPLTFVDRIKHPLLIAQGANDPRVKQAESDQIVRAMQAKKIPVTYVLFSDEGHGFQRPENRLAFNATTEAFLAQCVGGSYLPVGDDFKGSTIAVPAGADEVVGLKAALTKPAKSTAAEAKP